MLIAALVAIASVVMINLGLWQLRRLGERRALNAQIAAHMTLPRLMIDGEPPESERLNYRPVAVTGAYDFSEEIVLRNRSLSNVAGVHLITPLLIEGGDQAVLIDRGWIPYEYSTREQRTAYASPKEVVTVNGLLRLSQTASAPIGASDPTLSPSLPRLDAWFWLNIPQIQNQIPYRLLSFFVEQDPNSDPKTLPVTRHEIDLSEGPHVSYAIQWFSFAAILVIGSFAFIRYNIRS